MWFIFDSGEGEDGQALYFFEGEWDPKEGETLMVTLFHWELIGLSKKIVFVGNRAPYGTGSLTKYAWENSGHALVTSDEKKRRPEVEKRWANLPQALADRVIDAHAENYATVARERIAEARKALAVPAETKGVAT